MSIPRDSDAGGSVDAVFSDPAGKEPGEKRTQFAVVAIAFALGAILLLGWIVVYYGRSWAEESAPSGSSQSGSVGTPTATDPTSGTGTDEPDDAFTSYVPGPRGANAAQLLARATSAKVVDATADGNGWRGGSMKVEIQRFSRIVTGKIDRGKGETAPSQDKAEYFIEVVLDVTNNGQKDVSLANLDFALMDAEHHHYSSSKADVGLGEDAIVRRGQKTTLKVLLKVRENFHEGTLFFGVRGADDGASGTPEGRSSAPGSQSAPGGSQSTTPGSQRTTSGSQNGTRRDRADGMLGNRNSLPKDQAAGTPGGEVSGVWRGEVVGIARSSLGSIVGSQVGDIQDDEAGFAPKAKASRTPGRRASVIPRERTSTPVREASGTPDDESDETSGRRPSQTPAGGKAGRTSDGDDVGTHGPDSGESGDPGEDESAGTSRSGTDDASSGKASQGTEGKNRAKAMIFYKVNQPVTVE